MGKSTPIVEMGDSVMRGGANSHGEGEREREGLTGWLTGWLGVWVAGWLGGCHGRSSGR